MPLPWDPRLLEGPFFESLAGLREHLPWPAGSWPGLADYQAWLDRLPSPPRSGGGVPLKVVAPAAGRGGGQAEYEARIYREGELQTRPANWHDLLNLLAWAAFPRTKGALNQRHMELREAGAAGDRSRRSPAVDALTQFDETGVIIACADPELAVLLSAFRWKELFWRRRARVRSHMACYLLGHGLMEKALTPYRGMTGKGVVVAVEAGFFSRPPPERLARLDAAAAQAVVHLSRPADLQPVPVLGFPGFTPDSECEAYYDDDRHFRPGRGGRQADPPRHPS